MPALTKDELSVTRKIFEVMKMYKISDYNLEKYFYLFGTF